MLLVILLMLVALVANFWLWGQWSTEMPTWWSLTLGLNSLFIILLYVFSIRKILRTKAFNKSLRSWPIVMSLGVILILTALLYKYTYDYLISSIYYIYLAGVVVVFIYGFKKKRRLKKNKKQ